MSKEEKMHLATGEWDIRRGKDDFRTSARSRVADSKHNTLESDEEDAEPERHGLDENERSAQEEAVVDVEDGIVFTPFNMRDEMQEGHFDADGTYIFNKDKDKKENFRDNWLDDEVDWSKVKETEKLAQRRRKQENLDMAPEEILDQTDVYRQMLTLMRPGESVAKTIRRLGGGGKKDAGPKKRPGQNLSAWKQKRQKLEGGERSGGSEETADGDGATSSTSEARDSSKDDLLKMIGLADSLVSIGCMTIYSDTFEALSYRVKQQEEKSKPLAVADSGFDMFGDEIPAEKPAQTNVASKSQSSVSGENPADSEIKWEYKWKNEEGAEMHGPFTSTQMLDWTTDGYFPEGVYVRKVGNNDKAFYSSKRIDFDLYI